MKLGNFSSIDPQYSGSGLSRGNRLEQIVWDYFAADPDRLSRVAASIRELSETGRAEGLPREYLPTGEEEEFPEGKLLARLHVCRERNPEAVSAKKKQTLETSGRLACEVCRFDFESRYGQIGSGYAECHHTTPVAELREGHQTRLRDLAIVCSNCHRMLHHRRPLYSVSELRREVDELRVRRKR
jgi:5-methylcytosine-specific restriction protein A